MSHQLPPDLDRLIWEVAESQDTHAYDDFERRFPQYVGELGKRIKVVRDLRVAGDVPNNRPRPRFDRRAPSRVGPSRQALIGGMVLLTVLAFGTFALTNKLINQPQDTVKKVNPSELDITPHLPEGQVAVKTPETTPAPTPPPSQTQHDPGNSAQSAPYDRPQDVKLDRVKLKTALLAIAASGGLDLEFAPNMPNPQIKIQYQGMSTVDILKDLGGKFGFTPFKEGERSILVVPARDPKAPVLPPATGSGYAVSLDDEDQAGPATDSLPASKGSPAPKDNTGKAPAGHK